MKHSVDDICNMIRKIINDELRESIIVYFDKYEDEFFKCPGSIMHHHAYFGGLVDHTFEVCEFAIAIGNNCGIKHQEEKIFMENDTLVEDPNHIFWNDRLLIPPLLHDFGKINEYMLYNGKWTYKMAKEDSKNYDHAVWVVNDFRKECGINLPGDIRNAILAHHGGWTTNGAKCDTLLDSIIHAADLISSRVGK